MLIPRLCFGRADIARLLMAHQGFDDDGLFYDIFLRTDRFPPAGIDGETAFYALHLALSYEVALPIDVIAIIDDVRQPVKHYDLPALGAGVRKNTILEVSLMVGLPNTVPGYATRGLFAPRGTWVQVELASTYPGAASFVQLDALQVEIDPVQDWKREGPNP
jgi:hypothetical protein